MRHEEYVVDEEIVGPFKVKVVGDPDPENPATNWDWPGMEMCLDFGRYGEVRTPNMKDKDPRQFLAEVLGKDEDGEEVKSDYNDWLIRPVYAYIHSGVTISMGAFSCPWDSGCCGYVALDPNHEDFVGLTDEQKEKRLERFVDTVDRFLTGQVYGFVVERECDGEFVDSCYGFFEDSKDVMKEGKASAKYHLKDHDDIVKHHAAD